VRLSRGVPTRVVPRVGARLLRLAYVAVIGIATLTGLDASGDLTLATARFWRALHPPIRPSDVVDGARNIALFAGFGAVWFATAAPGRLRAALGRATLAGALVSASVEAVQLFSPLRMASVLDVATNTAGAFVGAFGIALGVAAARARPPRPLVPPPVALVALPYVGACMLEAFSPFGRSDQLPGVWGGPASRWAAALAHLREHPHAAGAWTDPLLFAPAGVLTLLLWVERGGRPWPGVLAVTLALGTLWTATEGLRGVAGGDMAPWAVAVRTVAVLVGAAVMAAALRSTTLDEADAGIQRARAWLARRGPMAYAALLLVWSWRPFGLVGSLAAAVASLGPEAWIPLAAQAQSFTLHSVADVAVGFLLYVPVGAWLAARSLEAGHRVRALWPGLALALAAEGGQALITARTVDVTDLLVQGSGVFLGWAIVRQARALARRAPPPGVERTEEWTWGGNFTGVRDAVPVSRDG
jgi:VanZ family protein